MQVGQRLGPVEIWAGDQRLAIHPRAQSARAQSAGQRFTIPGQWEGLPRADGHPQQEALAVQVPVGDVERRSLEVYDLVRPGGRGRCQGTTIALEQARQHLETLGLKQAVEALDNSLDTAASKQLT